MLALEIVTEQGFNEKDNKFVPLSSVRVEFEHSLVSLSKWESKHKKPFLSRDPKHKKTKEETLDYLRCMIINDVPPEIINYTTKAQGEIINNYIADPMTATWFADDKTPSRQTEIHTAEVLYYYMVTLGIPWEAQYWHINRLITLIKVISAKNAPPKKRSASEMAAERRALNEQRLRAFKAKG